MIHLNKFLLKSFKIAGFLCFSSSVLANNICEKFYKKPNISTTINYGNVVYKSIAKEDFLKFDKLINPNKTLGLTVADIEIKYDFDFDRYKVNNGVCVNFSNVNFFVGYKNLDVLIDSKYSKGSCQYNAIKEHEKGHIYIYQKELKYYGNLLLNELRQIILDLPPIYFSKDISQNKIAFKLDEIILNNENIILLKNKLESSILKLNKDYDNEEEYIRVNSLCKNW